MLGLVEGVNPPYGTPAIDLAAMGYAVEEYYLEGTTVAYEYLTNPAPDGHWEAEASGMADYRTRLLVVRPTDPARFNGTVVLNWQNVSAGSEPAAPSSGEIYNGFAWVGVSAQEVGIFGFPAGLFRSGGYRGAPPLADRDPERYRSLRHPGDQGSFDIFTQAARAVGPDRSSTVDPLGGLDVQGVVALGGSQSAMRLVAYANAVHPQERAVDGFLLTVWEGRAPRLGDGSVSFGAMKTAVRDLDVPVLIVNSEFEAPNLAALGLADTDLRRIWEVTGTPHGVAQVHGDRPDDRGRVVNRLSYRPVYEAALRHLQRWITDATPAPAQPRIEFEADSPPTFRRDQFGNALGGIRLPELAAPTKEYHGMGFGTGRMPLFGFARPFTDDELRSLYPSRQTFIDRWHQAVDALVTAGALRPEDGPAMRARADDEAPSLT